MLKVEVWYHKDGDHLAIVNVPWWVDAYEYLIVNRFCPCCGISGWLSGKSEKFSELFWRMSDWLQAPIHTKRKELFQVPIANGCVASRALWPEREPSTCFRDDCENCWDWKDDAYQYKAPEPIR